MLSKAKGRISITAQFSFPPKSNEIFQNCWPAYATVKLSPPKLNTVRPSQSLATAAITPQGTGKQQQQQELLSPQPQLCSGTGS